jgi:hypothetical protein
LPPPPESGAVTAHPRELIKFARQHGYALDELIRIIEGLG